MATVIWVIALISLIDIMAIEYLESAFSFEHDIPSPFESLSFSETLLWLLTFASTGYTQGFSPVSVIGKVLAMIMPILGIGTALSTIIAFAHSKFQIKDHKKRECDYESKEEFWFELIKQGYTLRNKYGFFYLKGPKRWWSFFHVPDIYEITLEFYLLIAGSRYDKR